jgi:deoxyhypusine synthase
MGRNPESVQICDEKSRTPLRIFPPRSLVVRASLVYPDRMTPETDHAPETVAHIDPTSFNAVPIIDQMSRMAFQARNLARASRIVNKMLEEDLTVILTLAGRTISAGMKHCLLTMIRSNMVDAIVSTGATMVDMDFFEALGFRHYIGDPSPDGDTAAHRNRLEDAYADEDDLRACDEATEEVARSLQARPYSSREIMEAMGKYLADRGKGEDSVLRTAYEMQIPIFVPSFSDCSAGFGFVRHQVENPGNCCTHDSVADFRELTQLKIQAGDTGMVIIGGGVPKNFTADTVVCAQALGHDVAMHKYAIQLTVADDHDGAVSGSALRESHARGAEDMAEQMVFGEFSLTFPLMTSYLYHKGDWKKRRSRRLNEMFREPAGA